MESGAGLKVESHWGSLFASNRSRKRAWQRSPGTAIASESEESAVVDQAFEAALGDAPERRFDFRDMRLKTGDRIQLQPPPVVDGGRHVVKLIGYVDKVGLLVTAPQKNGVLLPLAENDEIVARTLSSQNVFAFSSIVKRVCKTPYSYLHLSFPERIHSLQIRKAPRVRTNIVAMIGKSGHVEGKSEQQGVIVNLSADGACIRLRTPLFDEGETIRLSFDVTLHSVDAHLVINAVVRSTFCNEDRDGGSEARFNHGLQFQDLPPNDSALLQSLIYRQMIEEPHSVA